MLIYVFLQRDTAGEGLLKMDDIREAYSEYCGGLVESNDIDSLLSKCNVLIKNRGMLKYQQFIQAHAKRQVDVIKAQIRAQFQAYDAERTNQVPPKPYLRPGMVYKSEVKKIIAAMIARANNNQHESMLLEHDKDQDDYLNVEELIGFIGAMAQ